MPLVFRLLSSHPARCAHCLGSSALLLLGNVTFNQDDNDRADVANKKDLDAAEALLGCGSVTSELTTRTVQRGGGGKRASTYTIDFNKLQVWARAEK